MKFGLYNIEGTNTLVMAVKAENDGLLGVGIRMNAITHIGWYLRTMMPISMIVGLLILYTVRYKILEGENFDEILVAHIENWQIANILVNAHAIDPKYYIQKLISVVRIQRRFDMLNL